MAQKKSPLQQVQAAFGSKEKLVDELLTKLVRPEGETADEHKKRLLRVSNRHLLSLHANFGSLQKEFGGRAAAADAILKAERPGAKKVDGDYRAALLKRSQGWLLDRARAHRRRAAAAG